MEFKLTPEQQQLEKELRVYMKKITEKGRPEFNYRNTKASDSREHRGSCSQKFE
jgi:hypothetical protein